MRNRRSVGLAVLLNMVTNANYACRATIWFAYLRTTVSCDTAQVIDPSSTDWSGSLWCGDKDFVAREAQLRYGLIMMLNYTLQCLSLSILGALGDVWGRKAIINLSCLSNILEASVNIVIPRFPFIVAGRAIQALDTQAVMTRTIIADCATTQEERERLYALYVFCGNLSYLMTELIVNRFVVEAHFYSYRIIWIIIAALNAFALLLSILFLLETLGQNMRRELSCKMILPCSSIAQINNYPFLRYLIWAASLFVMGLTVASINSAYSVEVFSWPQERYTYVDFISTILSVFAIGASLYFLPKYGSERVMKLAVGICLLSMIIVSFSGHSSRLFTVGSIVFGIGFVGLPAYYSMLSQVVPASKQGTIQSAFSSVTLLVGASAYMLYSYIFKVAPENLSFLPYLISCIFLGLVFPFLHYGYKYHGQSFSLLSPNPVPEEIALPMEDIVTFEIGDSQSYSASGSGSSEKMLNVD